MIRPHPLIPEFVLENDAAGIRQGAMHGAVLFVDITGFSRITDALLEEGPHGSEVLATFIRAVFKPIIETIYAFQGFVAIQAGDACTAIFNEPDDPSTVCKLALAAAQRMQQYMRERPTYETPYGVFDVSLKIGLAFGEISWGIVESENKQRATYYFMGSVIDQSASAEHEADPGEIALDTTLLDILSNDISIIQREAHYVFKEYAASLPQPGHFEHPVINVELASRFYPRQLFTQEFGGEFRQVLNLFISLPTVRDEKLLVGFLQTCFRLMDRYGGFLNRVDFGDKGANLLMFWGAPIAFENDIERALKFVLELQSQTTIPIKAGVTYQMAHAVFMGSDLKEEYTAFGRGVNLAARFMSAAPRGEVWVDEAVAQFAKNQFVLESEGELVLKGFSLPQKVFSVIEPHQSVRTKYSYEIVDREVEIAELERFVQPVFDGRFAGAALVIGETGLGKTRLLHEFAAVLKRKQEKGYQIFRGHCDEILRESLNPIRFWLRTYFNYSDFQVEVRNKRNFNRRLDDLIATAKDKPLARELDRTRSFLGAILGLYWSDSLYEQLSAQDRYENTISALTSLIRCESRGKPTIFFIEDIHWMDRDTRAFLRLLLQMLAGSPSGEYPIAIVTTARPVRQFNLGEGQDFYRIELKELAEDSVSVLAQNVLGGALSPELLRVVNERSEGNPLFAEQILLYLFDRGLIEKRPEYWTLEVGAGRILPSDIRRLLTARLDLLPLPLKEAIQIASILGREFDESLFAEMLDGEAPVHEILADGLRARIWVSSVRRRYVFTHALLWEAIYRMQLRETRQAMHARALDAAENLYGRLQRTHFGELGYHAEQARLPEKAMVYLKKAGDAAREDYQNRLAEDFYARALAQVGGDDNEYRFEILLAKQEVNGVLGENEIRAQDLEVMQQIAETLNKDAPRARTAFNQATLFFDLDDMQQATEYLRRTLHFEDVVSSKEVIYQAYALYSQVLMRQGDVDAGIDIAHRGLRLARKSEDQPNESILLNSMGMLMIEKQDYAQAAEQLKESLRIASTMKDIYLRSLPLNNLGLVASFEGDYSSAQNYYHQSLEIARKIGRKKNMGICLGNLGWVAGVLGEIDKALECNQQQLDIAREVGNRFSEAFSLINLSAVSITLGNYEDALAYAEEGQRVAEKIKEVSGQAWALTYAGHSLVGLAQYADAAEVYQRALQIRHELNQPALATEPTCGLAQIALVQGNRAEAKRLAEEVEAYIEGGGTLEGTDDPLRVMFTCYLVKQEIDHPAAQTLLAMTYETLMERAGQIVDPETRKSYLQNIPLHKKIIRAWEARMIEV